MNDLELAELAMNSLRYRSLRSWLAVLGIVIGVASIISLISISQGLNANIQGSISGLGANIMTITPGAPRADRVGFGGPAQDFGRAATDVKITFAEADALRNVEGVAKVDARVSGNAHVSYKIRNTSISVIGTDPSAFPQSTGTNLSIGRQLGISDTSSVVLGYSVATQTFNDSNMINKQIKINGQPFRVVGVLNTSGTSFGGPDRSIFITQRAAKDMFNQTDRASSVVVIAADGYNPDIVAASVTAKLLALHRLSVDKQDFTVTTASSTQSAITSITNTLGLFLGGIASISLIVGGIGVANAMFTSVLEQTRYIGILKALGARNGAILKLFLYEACMVGLVGGTLGIALSFVASFVLASFGLPSKITPDLLLLGMGFSVIVGAVAGLIPARNASSVAPVEALRYE
ncbi:MAG: ABC transporter permease [Candidatus Micrarchaeia archaeon]|jgi:putative ABC transport system permease protein